MGIRDDEPCPTCGSIHDKLMAAVQESENGQKAAMVIIARAKKALEVCIEKKEIADAVARLAARAKEVVFDDPGDAVMWGKVIGDWEESNG